MKKKTITVTIFRLLAIAFFLYIAFKIKAGNESHMLHSINLIFHEAGHIIFMFFGEFVHFIAGTGMQLLVPIVFLLYFLLRRDLFSSSIMLWWVGTNLADIGIYMADAQTQVLPLLGGGRHDWYYIFGQMGLLQKDYAIGVFTSTLGMFCMFGGLALALYITLSQAGAIEALKRMAQK